MIVSSSGFDSYRDYMNGDIKGWTSGRYMPKLLNYKLEEIPFDFYEMIGALAPRVCFINAPLGDGNFKWKSVDNIVGEASKVYKMYGVPQNLMVRHPNSAHDFPDAERFEAYRVLESSLR